MFFFEKNNQKTFATRHTWPGCHRPQEQKSFASFLQKRRRFLPRPVPRPQGPSLRRLDHGIQRDYRCLALRLGTGARPVPHTKRFLLLFFKKEDLPF
jgi:hypothetical protein